MVAVKIAWERKKTKRKQLDNNAMARAPPIYTQPMQGGWTHGQGNYKGCGLVEGRKWSISNI